MSIYLVGLTPIKAEAYAIGAGILVAVTAACWMMLSMSLLPAVEAGIFAGLYWYGFKFGEAVTYDGIPTLVLGPLVGVGAVLALNLVYVFGF